MSYFQEKYKCKTAGFSNITAGRRIRANKQRERSKNDRDDIINQRRNVSPIITNAQSEGTRLAPVKENRLTRLQKWKAERDKRRKQEKYKKKQPFVVGIIHHKLYSPISQERPVVPKNVCPSVPKRITRATEKRLMNKAAVQKNNVKNTVKNLTSKNTDINKEQKNEGNHKKSFAPEGYTFKPPAGLPSIPLFGRVVIESMSPAMLNISAVGKNSSIKKTRKSIMETRKSIMETRKSTLNTVKSKLSFNGDKASDYRNKDIKNENIKENTTKAVRSRDSSRGKSNRLSIKNASSTIDDTIELNTSYTLVKEGEYTADYYQLMLNNEVAKLNEMSQKWKEIKGKSGITRDERYEINETICQTNFVINHKLERFRGFIANCQSGGMFVKCEDLQELWDMACADVKDCVRRFEKLEELHSQICQEQETLANKPSVGKKTPMKKKSVQ
ncbi:uncharacterized protein LOC143425093 [Xylocopa sonorina]|uniref:uncharacterized protein LOC143425093 n=1 Tax=Xylocopa sonorina TaxID=1818115 RepID=UPI00403AEABB